jgi:hypothetical protein
VEGLEPCNTKCVFIRLSSIYGIINLHNVPKSELGLPVCDETLLRYFVVHCSENLGLSYVTIKSYLSAVRNLYVSRGLGNPLVHPISGEPLHQLALLCRGLKKSQPLSKNLRQPFTGVMLLKLSMCLRNGLFGQYLDTLLEAACMLAFFGFLRCGEFTTVTEQFDPNLNLCLGDVLLTNNCVHISIKVSKTDPFRKGCSIQLFHNGSPLCPYTALAKYLSMRKCISKASNTPLFLLPGIVHYLAKYSSNFSMLHAQLNCSYTLHEALSSSTVHECCSFMNRLISCSRIIHELFMSCL